MLLLHFVIMQIWGILVISWQKRAKTEHYGEITSLCGLDANRTPIRARNRRFDKSESPRNHQNTHDLSPHCMVTVKFQNFLAIMTSKPSRPIRDISTASYNT